jgi:ubiquinone/menaquinone biosynthesis C-methylase UbiE
MTRESIAAYDTSRRVKSYDADMVLMHPNRSKMVQVVLEVLPFLRSSFVRALDLGVGTGYFTERFLKEFPNSEVVAIDGARAMIDLARVRLGALRDRVQFVVGDFRNLQQLTKDARGFDVVFSAYALHHLNRADKETVLRQAVDLLRPRGWFMNADLVVADSPEIDKRMQDLRVSGIVERAAGADKRFVDAASTRRFLDDLEAGEGDQPLTIADDLGVLRRSGLKNASVFWFECRELVSGGQKEPAQ